MSGSVFCEPGIPFVVPLLAAFNGHARVLLGFRRNKEVRIFGPAIKFLCRANLVFAERLAVCGGGVLLLGSAPSNVAVEDDQRRTSSLLLRSANCALNQT